MTISGVLLLNATYEPLTVLSAKRAFKLVCKERVEPVVADEVSLLGSEHPLSVPTPHEAGMKLHIEPKTPQTNYLLATSEIPSSWKVWIEF